MVARRRERESSRESEIDREEEDGNEILNLFGQGRANILGNNKSNEEGAKDGMTV